MIKSCGARNVIVIFLASIWSGNFQFLVSQHAFLRELPYGFVIDFQLSEIILQVGQSEPWVPSFPSTNLQVHYPEATT